MARDCILFLAVVATASVLAGPGSGPAGVACGQTPAVSATADPEEAADQPILQDNFDDNKMGKLWKTYQEDPNSWATEVNQRLEFRTKDKTSGAFSGYIADGWWVDPNTDFSLKVDLHYDLDTLPAGWICFGLTPDPNQPRDEYVALGIGCANRNPSYWREWKDGYDVRWDFVSRFLDRVTLYISYDALEDEIYLSDSDYGSEAAWQVLPGIVHGLWPRKPLFVFFGVTASGPVIDSGHAFADNFTVDSGRLVKISESNEPLDVNDPNQPADGYRPPDVAAPLFVVPAVIDRGNTTGLLTSIVALPPALTPADVDQTQPFLLWPGPAQALTHSIFLWLSGNTIVMASFDNAKLLQVVPDGGPAELKFRGTLKDGRTFGGTYTVLVR